MTRVESTGKSSRLAGSQRRSQAIDTVMIRCPRGRSTVNTSCSPNGDPAPPHERSMTASFFAYPQISRPATSGISLSVKMKGWYR
jgi:hypothetical protein